jgi:hypothetical protein
MWREEALCQGYTHIVSVPSARNHNEMIDWLKTEGYLYHRDVRMLFESSSSIYSYAFKSDIVAAAFKVRWG